jgi:hypothetical protein
MKYIPVAKIEAGQTEDQFGRRLGGQHKEAVNLLLAALLKEMPNLKFRSVDTYRNEVAVYREGDAFAWGWVGFGDYSRGSNTVRNRYTVSSHNIDNAKYANGSDQRNMSMTDNVDKAVKLVKKYLRAIPKVDGAKASIHELNEAYLVSNAEMSKKLTSNANAIVGNNPSGRFLPTGLENAFAMLRMQGVTIGDNAFNQIVNDYFDAKDSFSRLSQFSGKVYYVHPHMRLGVPTYDTVSVVWDNTVNRSLPWFKVPENPTLGYIDALTDFDMEAIKERVSVLYMMQTPEFVHGVGVKLDTNRYVVVV